ncbi:MAG: helix-turn-helix domain-containing protein [Microbacterium sp.]
MATTTTPAARTAHGRRRRQQILDAAAVLFVDPGYRATSLRDIAAAAGISHPGLLRHFSSKGELLRELVERVEDANESWLLAQERAGRPTTAVEIARRNSRQPGYLALFSALAGEATASTHPAHERMSRRYAGMRSRANADAFLPLGTGRTLADESVRLVAGWDGLQLLQLYLPDRVDVVRELERHQRLIAQPYAWGTVTAAPAPGPVPPVDVGVPDASEPAGNAAGRARRQRIVRDATALFAAEGYGETSMRTIAQRVGVSKSSLFHHYPTKEDLLRAVLAARDAGISRHTPPSAGSAAELLRDLPRGAAENARAEPGLIEVYSVLSCEAAAARHPAHEYFRARFTAGLDTFRELFAAAARDGHMPAHRDPEGEAVWLVSLWDGLQIQWLYDRDGIDVAAHLAAHLDDVLPRR